MNHPTMILPEVAPGWLWAGTVLPTGRSLNDKSTYSLARGYVAFDICMILLVFLDLSIPTSGEVCDNQVVNTSTESTFKEYIKHIG